MPFISPDITTVFEDWTDDGLPLWQSTDPDGAPSTLIATGGQGAVSAIGGAKTVQEDDDQARVIPIDTAGGTLIAYYFRWQDSSNFYEFLLQGSNWRLRKVVAGSPSDISTATGQAYSSGDRFYPLIIGDTFELYQYTSGAWNETPVLSGTDSTFTAAGESALVLGDSSWRIGDILDVDTTGPTSPVTIYVDATTGDDARTRLEASDPDTPVATIARAAELAVSAPGWDNGDIIQVEPSDDANPDDPVDTSVYDFFEHVRDVDGALAPTLPYGDNTGNRPIVLKGNGSIDDDTAPKIRGFVGRFIRNWEFQDFQVGYDSGSGDDVLGRTTFSACADVAFRRLHFTSGGIEFNAWTGTIEIDSCVINAPLSDQKSSLDGRGFGFGYLPDYTGGTEGAALAWIHHCTYHNIRGNDANQVGLGAFDDPDSHFLFENNLVYDVTEGDEAYHTDAIQSLGGARYTIRRNAFLGCSDAFIASDFHNGTITIEENLIVGAGSQLQIQGYEECIIRNNTIIPASDFGRNASIMFFTRQAGTAKLVTIENNIYGGIFYLDTPAAAHHVDSSIDNNAVLSAPGASTGFGTNLAGIPEFGTSARMAGLPTSLINFPSLPANYELANTIANPAIAAGLSTDLATDRLGRALTSPPDIGCHQSSISTPVTPVARAPYLITLTPADGATAVARDITVEAVLYPKPGETIDETTVTASTAFVTDPDGLTIPALITIGDTDEDGRQTLELDLRYSPSPARDGRLDYLVVYTIHLTAGIEDTEGSALSAAQATFRVVGRGAPAITPVGVGFVGLRSIRSATLLAAGPVSAAFTSPESSAGFEQAESTVARP